MRKSVMRRIQRIVLLAGLVALAPILTGCENFDMDKLDVFGLSDKKKLPGDRKPLFPQGVPGVSQGIPPEYIKGNQPPPDSAQTPPAGQDANAPAAAADPAKQTAAAEPVAEPKPKPRKPKVAKQKLIPDQNPPPAQAQQQAPAPWPTAPASGNVSR